MADLTQAERRIKVLGKIKYLLLSIWLILMSIATPMWIAIVYMNITGHAKGYAYDLNSEKDISVAFGVVELLVWLVLLCPALIKLCKKIYADYKKLWLVPILIFIFIVAAVIALIGWDEYLECFGIMSYNGKNKVIVTHVSEIDSDVEEDIVKEGESMEYIFKSEENMENLKGSSKICNIIDGFEDYGNNLALVYGRIKRLFDKPVFETENMEELFSYCVSARKNDGDVIYLDVYCAGSGPAIGGAGDEKSKEAAQALKEYICGAEPLDYECKCYYMDAPAVIEMGVKNGIPYYNEAVLELSEEEFKALYSRLYNLDLDQTDQI